MLKSIMEFHKNDKGDVVQTAILIAVFSILAVGGYIFLAPRIKDLFNKAGKELDKVDNFSY